MPSITNKSENANESQVETNGLMTPNADEAVEPPELTHCGGSAKTGQPRCDTVWWFLRKFNTHLQ